MGLLTEVVAPGKHLSGRLEMAEGLASFPQETMLADRRSAIEGFGLRWRGPRPRGRDRQSGHAASESRAPPASPPARAAAARRRWV